MLTRISHNAALAPFLFQVCCSCYLTSILSIFFFNQQLTTMKWKDKTCKKPKMVKKKKERKREGRNEGEMDSISYNYGRIHRPYSCISVENLSHPFATKWLPLHGLIVQGEKSEKNNRNNQKWKGRRGFFFWKKEHNNAYFPQMTL